MADKETDWSRDVLERIVALLFSLAALADLAAGVSALRRRHVLGILAHGEAEARAFLTGTSVDEPDFKPALHTAADAACLAARLRMLALLLCAMLARPRASPSATGQRSDCSSSEVCRPTVGRLGAPAPRAPDTS